MEEQLMAIQEPLNEDNRTLHSRVTVHKKHKGPLKGHHPSASMTSAGATAHFQVSYVSSLGQKGKALADALLANCERDYNTLEAAFCNVAVQNLPFVVQVTSDSTGASHSSCMGTDISIGGNSDGNVDFIRSLLVAEVDEVFMANFGRGWDCGASNGEGLSRVLAGDIYQGVTPPDFIASNVWLNQNSREDWVNTTDGTDRNYNSIGCAVLFLNWLRFQLKHPWKVIIEKGDTTLAGTYLNLTGKATAWTEFSTFMEQNFPSGRNYNLDTDNPFPV
jgi:hypothetical protein